MTTVETIRDKREKDRADENLPYLTTNQTVYSRREIDVLLDRITELEAGIYRITIQTSAVFGELFEDDND